MPQIKEVFIEGLPDLRFIGKQYREFGHWDEWFAAGWFDEIERAMGGIERIKAIWRNGGGYVGLERHKYGEPFVYWIGMFVPADTPVPDGFDFIDFPAGGLGTCWLYGKENEVHNTADCLPALIKAGMEPRADQAGAMWSFENCLCPRYTTPDADGNIILDYCYFVM